MRATATILVGLTALLSTPASGWDAFRNIPPEKAIMAAAKAGPDGVSGTFKMVVRNVGPQDGGFYLNSELDYRDQRNLTVAMSEETGRSLEKRIGASSDNALIGRKIFVRGTARRVKIVFTVNGQPTVKYYYQTHILVTDPVQIAVRDKL